VYNGEASTGADSLLLASRWRRSRRTLLKSIVKKSPLGDNVEIFQA